MLQFGAVLYYNSVANCRGAYSVLDRNIRGLHQVSFHGFLKFHKLERFSGLAVN